MKWHKSLILYQLEWNSNDKRNEIRIYWESNVARLQQMEWSKILLSLIKQSSQKNLFDQMIRTLIELNIFQPNNIKSSKTLVDNQANDASFRQSQNWANISTLLLKVSTKTI